MDGYVLTEKYTMWDKEWVWAGEFIETLLRQAAQRYLEEQAMLASIEPHGSKIPAWSQRAVRWIEKHLATAQ